MFSLKNLARKELKLQPHLPGFSELALVATHYPYANYCKIFNIRRTKPQNLNDSRLILQLSLPNPLKPGVKSRMKM